MDPFLAVLAGTFGSILGALVNYALAALVGEPVVRRFGKYVLISERSLDRTEAFFNRHGEISTFVGRLLPVIRHLISIPAGMARMDKGRFVLFTALGAGTWCAVLTYIGWFLGRHEAVIREAAYYTMAHQVVVRYVLPAVAVIVIGYVLWYRRRKARAG